MPLSKGVNQPKVKPMDDLRNLLGEHRRDQANKSARGMPWHQEPMKDAISCEKLRGGANIQRSGDIRMGKPTCKGILY